MSGGADSSVAACLRHGKGHKCAHSYPDHFVEQQYLPDNLRDRVTTHPRSPSWRRISAGAWCRGGRGSTICLPRVMRNEKKQG